MRRPKIRPLQAATAAFGVMIGVLSAPSPAMAACGTVIFDYVPGLHAVSCNYDSGPEETWTVPPSITKPTFAVRGADDATGGRGGFVRAKVPIEAGKIFDLTMAANGAASSVSLGGEPILVAGGGNGNEPNYIDPIAQTLSVEEPGQPLGPSIGNGSVFIEWYDAREPSELVDPLPYVIVDVSDSEQLGFPYTGAQQEWIVPEGVNHAFFELFGGPGESDEPRGHILAGLEVTPGETFHIWVGGHGDDTTLVRGGSFDVGVAAGGDTERPNYLPPMASPADEFWEGGGSESEPGDGYAIVHYWPAKPSTEVPFGDQSDTGHQAQQEPLPFASSKKLATVCIVPQLRNRTPRTARKLLSRANCRLSSVNRRPARKRVRGRIVSQSLRAGTMVPMRTGVAVTVGAQLPGR